MPLQRQTATIDIRVSGDIDDVKSFIQMCSYIQSLCNWGASREMRVGIDGDGSANLSFIDISNGSNEKFPPWPKDAKDERFFIGG